jgi:hypothetical protein
MELRKMLGRRKGDHTRRCAVLKKVSVGLALVAVGFLAGSLLIGSTGTAEPGWLMGDLTEVACRVGVQPVSGQYEVKDILNKIADKVGFPACPPPDCAACVAKLNTATYAEFHAIYEMGTVRTDAIWRARPFVVASCTGAASIENVLKNVDGIGDTLSRRIVQTFCPELYK